MKFLHPKSRRGFSRLDDCAEIPLSRPPPQSGYRATTQFRGHRFLVPSDCPATRRTRTSRRRQGAVCTRPRYWKSDHPSAPAHGSHHQSLLGRGSRHCLWNHYHQQPGFMGFHLRHVHRNLFQCQTYHIRLSRARAYRAMFKESVWRGPVSVSGPGVAFANRAL